MPLGGGGLVVADESMGTRRSEQRLPILGNKTHSGHGRQPRIAGSNQTMGANTELIAASNQTMAANEVLAAMSVWP